MDHRRWLVSLGLGVMMVGCAHSTHSANSPPENAASAETTSATSAAADDDQAAEGVRDHHRHHHGGVSQMLSMSIDTLGVSADESVQLRSIQTDLRSRLAPARDAEKGLLTTLANGVAAGAIDAKAADTAVAQVADAAGSAHDASLDALNRLHGVLSPVERAALIDKMQANWEVWRHVNSEEQMDSHMVGSRLQTLADEIDLTPDQVLTISTSLHNGPQPAAIDTDEGDAYMKKLRGDFTSNTFDAKTSPNGSSASLHMAKVGAARMVQFYETVTPVLTADQRTKVATQLRERLTSSSLGNDTSTSAAPAVSSN